MSDTKILQLILDGQKEIKDEVLENRKRIDKLGLQLAALEDDAPTMEDHEELVGRVDKLEEKVASV